MSKEEYDKLFDMTEHNAARKKLVGQIEETLKSPDLSKKIRRTLESIKKRNMKTL